MRSLLHPPPLLISFLAKVTQSDSLLLGQCEPKESFSKRILNLKGFIHFVGSEACVMSLEHSHAKEAVICSIRASG